LQAATASLPTIQHGNEQVSTSSLPVDRLPRMNWSAGPAEQLQPFRCGCCGAAWSAGHGCGGAAPAADVGRGAGTRIDLGGFGRANRHASGARAGDLDAGGPAA